MLTSRLALSNGSQRSEFAYLIEKEAAPSNVGSGHRRPPSKSVPRTLAIKSLTHSTEASKTLQPTIMSTRVICGLIPVLRDAEPANYPLVKATCTYRVTDVYTSADLVQEYYSVDQNPVQDIAYVFPLPPSAAVCGFKAVIDGTKVINGIVKEKEEAKQEYQKAISDGKVAGLLEKSHADGTDSRQITSFVDIFAVFRVSLGNIRPSQRVTVQ